MSSPDDLLRSLPFVFLRPSPDKNKNVLLFMGTEACRANARGKKTCLTVHRNFTTAAQQLFCVGKCVVTAKRFFLLFFMDFIAYL